MFSDKSLLLYITVHILYNQAVYSNNCNYICSYGLFLQVYDLKAEVSQLKSSKKQLSNELRKLKDKYHSLSQEFKESLFLDEADNTMGHLEEMLTKVKSGFGTLPCLQKLKV